MARYRKVDSRIWNDEKFLGLTDDGQLIFLFLLTHPHQTALGAMRTTIPGLASEKGWLTGRLSEAFAEALSKGMVRQDEKASCIWLPNFLKYNRPESPNVVRAWGSAADLIPECRLKAQCIQAAKDFLKAFKEPFRKAFAEVFGEVLVKDYALSGSGAGAGTGTVFQDPQTPVSESGSRAISGCSEGKPEYDPDQAWRDVETCDVEAYESWLEWRASQHDPVPARVRIEHAKFLSGKGTPEKQRAFVSELIQLQFKRFHDPGHSNGSTGGAISRRKTATDYDREAADRLASLPGKDPGPM